MPSGGSWAQGETGGALDHVAAQARERGIPAVVGAAGAADSFEDGDRVVVDGDAAVVARHIHARAPAMRPKPLNERELYQAPGYAWARDAKRLAAALAVLNQEFGLPNIDIFMVENRNNADGAKETDVKGVFDMRGILIAGESAIKKDGLIKNFSAVIPARPRYPRPSPSPPI